jgi:hypothetical protein
MTVAKQGYQIGESVATTLAEVATLLGVAKVTTKDVSEGGKYADQVQLIPLDEGGTGTGGGDGAEGDKDVNGGGDDKGAGGTDEGAGAANGGKGGEYSALGEEEIKATPEELAEALPEFETLDELKEFIKDIDTPTLEYFAKGLKLEWTGTYHASIHRMRIAQSMHRHFFPDQFKPKGDSKKKGKFGDLTTDKLFEMITERKLNVKKSGNEPIDRMRAIMALKTVGALAD